MEAKGKTLIQRKTELEAAAQAQQKERGALQMEITKLRKELQERESQRKLTELEEFPLSRSGMLSPPLPLTKVSQKTKHFANYKCINRFVTFYVFYSLVFHLVPLLDQHYATL